MKLVSKNGHGILLKENEIYFTTGEHFFKYHSDQIRGISRVEYLHQKYGKDNKYWNRPLDEFAKLRNGDFLTIFYQENELRLHNEEGRVKKKLEKIHSPHGMGVYGMAIDKNEYLWIAVPVEHYIGKFDIEHEQELFSICGDNLSPTVFDHPEYVTAIDDFVYIADMGNKRIVRINIENHQMEDYKKLNEPVFYFNQMNGKNIYLLQSGIYLEDT